MIEASVNSGDLQRIIKRMSRMNENVRQGCQREVAHSALAIQRMAKQNLTDQGAVATNRLRSSIGIRFTVDRLGAVVGTNVNYGPDVEFGQKPGRWPNVGDLMRWVRKKITSDRKMVKSLTWVIGKKIHDKGTEAKPYLFPAAAKEWPLLKRNLEKVLKTS